MKTPVEIAESIAQHIASVYLRPSMHVGSVEASYSANALDSLLYGLHYQWAFACEKKSEFQDAVSAQHKKAECSSFGFADAFRRIHKGDDNKQAACFVLRNWREISIAMQMPTTDRAGRCALEAEF
ncbi:MAG: hypothetical protein AAF456_13855 [Planctomycetota bacterium]